MASSKPPLSVIYSYDAKNELRGIYRRDIEKRGLSRADRYQNFLVKAIDALATTYEDGKKIEGFPELRSLTLKQGRSRWDDGHIVI